MYTRTPAVASHANVRAHEYPAEQSGARSPRAQRSTTARARAAHRAQLVESSSSMCAARSEARDSTRSKMETTCAGEQHGTRQWCGLWDASWGQGRARQRSAHLAAELSCQLAPAKSQTAIGRTCPSWRRHRHNPGHDHTTTGKVSTGAGIATAAPSRAIAPPILRAPPSVQPPKPRPSSEWAARTGGAAHQLTPFLCARLENKSLANKVTISYLNSEQ